MKKYLRKIVLLTIVTISVMGIRPICANAEWIKDNTGWWYTEGTSWVTGWREINDKWYYFDSNGYMAHDTTIEGYVVGSDGAWQENSNSKTTTTSSEDFQFDKSTGTITKYMGSDTDVVIPNEIDNIKVKSIGAFAFDGCYKLKSVTIPNGVISIGLYAFKECSNLGNIDIPNSVVSIESDAFYNCSELTHIKIPSSVVKIGLNDDPFWGCSRLTEILVGDGNCNYVSIDGVLFNKEKTKLIKYPEGKNDKRSYSIPETVSEIESGAFNCSNIDSIQIPNSVTKINDATFRGSNIKSIKLPDNLFSIGNYAFSYCYELTDIKIPNTVMSIGNNAFYLCRNLTHVNIPNGITAIRDYTFYECTSLTDIEIPNTVLSIGDYAFTKCTNLSKPKIPKSVKSIGRYAFEKTNPDDAIFVD